MIFAALKLNKETLAKEKKTSQKIDTEFPFSGSKFFFHDKCMCMRTGIQLGFAEAIKVCSSNINNSIVTLYHQCFQG